MVLAAFMMDPAWFVNLLQTIIDVVWAGGRALLQVDPVPGR